MPPRRGPGLLVSLVIGESGNVMARHLAPAANATGISAIIVPRREGRMLTAQFPHRSGTPIFQTLKMLPTSAH